MLCPCWVGEDPDGGTCDALVAWHVDKGTVNGVDVSGLTLSMSAHIPGNILKGNWRVVVFVDDKASPKQQDALLNVWTGKLGGPVADLAKLVGKVEAVRRAPITFGIKGGKGKVKVGQWMEAELAPFAGAKGGTTTLSDSVFTTIPGSPAYVAKASSYTNNVPELGLKINIKNHNAIQGTFQFTG